MNSLIATYGYTFTNNNSNDEVENGDHDINSISSNSTYQYHKLSNPLTMFKKKSPNKPIGNIEEIQNNDDLSKNDCTTFEPAKFVPSSLAGETYKKYVEMNKGQEQIKENIWSEVERKMKEIDQLKSLERYVFSIVTCCTLRVG